jgi:hypothetical protein
MIGMLLVHSHPVESNQAMKFSVKLRVIHIEATEKGFDYCKDLVIGEPLLVILSGKELLL